MYAYCSPHPRWTWSTLFFIICPYFIFLLFPFCSSASHQTLQKSIFTCRPSCWRRSTLFTPSCRRRCTLETDRETAAPQVRWSTNRPCICLRNILNSWFRWPGTSWARSEPGSATLGSVGTDEFGKRGQSLFQLLLEWHWAAFVQLIP